MGCSKCKDCTCNDLSKIAGTYTNNDWTEKHGKIQADLIDISEAVPFQMSYFGCNQFEGVVFHLPTRTFYHIKGDIGGVEVTNVNEKTFKEVFTLQ